LLHGILGSRRNWRSFGRRLAAAERVNVVTIDLRGHGDNDTRPAPHTLASCADDLDELAAAIGPPDVICGHSFGGKVAICWAARAPERLREAWILDSPPGAGATLPGQITRLIDVLWSIQTPVAARAEVADMLLAAGFPRSIAGWMTTNLKRVPASELQGGGLVWRFDLDVIAELLADYFRVDAWPMLADPSWRVRRRLLRGALSDRFDAQAVARLDALDSDGLVHHAVLADAGHWVHVDNPTGLLAWMATACKELPGDDA